MISFRRRFLRLAMLGSASALAMRASTVLTGTAIAAEQPSDTNTVNAGTEDNACNSLLSHEFRPLMGPEKRPLCEEFSDQVLLVVNTASRCGFTPQFEDLEKLNKQYSARGFRVLGFPSGDFRQELSTEEEVAQFCELNYGVTFPMFEKIHVTGDNAHPFYRQLAEATGSYPRWNFNKYLINRDGVPVAHYHSSAMPMGRQILDDIEALLQEAAR